MPIPTTTVVRSRPSTILLTMVLAVLGLVAACGTAPTPGGSVTTGPGGVATSGNTPGGEVATPIPTMTIKSFAYVPPSLTVAPGTKITVINEDKAPHTVTASDNSFDSGTIRGGQRGEVTAPSTPGTYPYICTIHPSMKGTVIVQ